MISYRKIFLLIAMFMFCLPWSLPASLSDPVKIKPKTKNAGTSKVSSPDAQLAQEELHQWYIDFLEQIFKTMDENYYQPVSREIYNRFIEQFNNKIYSQLKETGKSDNYVKWRSASMLVEKLKSKEDIFSELYPPKPAVEYKQQSLGTRIDLGIEGRKVKNGYQVTRLEPHSDAYMNGLRENHIITEVNKKKTRKLREDKIKEALNPLVNTRVKIKYIDVHDNNIEKSMEVISKEYFRQTVFFTPIKVPGVFCLKIEHFNQNTGEDLFRYLKFIKEHGAIRGLILDLRDNPGGPPLAAREISSFFLSGGNPFAYFQKKGQPPAWLDVPQLPEQYHYDGPLVILINEKSGSASELFSGILQRQKRAILMGTRSAGQVLLKSMFNFDDESMLLLVTGRGHHPDGTTFSFQGLIPDHLFEQDKEVDILNYAAKFLVYLSRHQSRVN